VLIVHGRDGGLDEFSPSGTSIVAEVRADMVRTYEVQPADFGLPSGVLGSVSGGRPDANARQTVAVVTNEARDARRSLVLMTAGAALYAAGVVHSLVNGVEMAASTLDSGRAELLLARLQADATTSLNQELHAE
jgi:anthranilate phosphoribosyltransferase